MIDLAGKPIAITGASSGIGLATAKRFLAEDWAVALLDIEEQQLREAATSLADPVNVLALHCDVSDAGAVHAAMARINAQIDEASADVSGVALGEEMRALKWALFGRMREGSLDAAKAGKALEILRRARKEMDEL